MNWFYTLTEGTIVLVYGLLAYIGWRNARSDALRSSISKWATNFAIIFLLLAGLDAVSNLSAMQPMSLVRGLMALMGLGLFLMFFLLKEDGSEASHGEAESLLAAAFESAPNGMVMVDSAGRILLSNSKFETMFGYSKTELRKLNIDDFLPLPLREAHKKHRHDFALDPKSRAMGSGRDLFGLSKDGISVPVEIGLTPVTTAQGLCIIGSVVDITERLRFVRSLEEKNRELMRSNSDLDDFAYAASHDLKSPLRGIQHLAEWIQEEAGDQLPPQASKDLKTLKDRVSRMNRILDGLLKYARVGRSGQTVQLVDVGQIIGKIAGLLDKPAAYKIITQGTMPVFETLEAPLTQVLMNLISNAINHRSKDWGSVTISCEDLGHQYQFDVMDDGPGIDEEHLSEVFGLFKTLKPKDQTGASGIGLAIVKKAVEALGGTIVAKNNTPDEGVTFSFTWRKSLNV